MSQTEGKIIHVYRDWASGIRNDHSANFYTHPPLFGIAVAGGGAASCVLNTAVDVVENHGYKLRLLIEKEGDNYHLHPADDKMFRGRLKPEQITR